jgi:glycosyltransferase involved in cell wall biosynthesis
LNELYSDIEALLGQIPIDDGGGGSIGKAHLLAWLIRKYELSTTLDIGVYRGRSLFPQALAHSKFTKGVVYGVDPWEAAEAKEVDLVEELKAIVDEFIEQTDFEQIYRQVLLLRKRLHYERHCSILRTTSADAARFFEAQGVLFGLIHIDGNHDTNIVMRDVKSYLPRLKANGFVVLDDISWTSVRPAYHELMTRLRLVYKSIHLPENDYAIFWDSHSYFATMILRMVLYYVDQRQNPEGRLHPRRILNRHLTPIRKQARSVYRRLKSRLNQVFDNGVVAVRNFVSRVDTSNRLLILDDIFPQMLSAFRIAEFNTYLERLEHVRVCSTANAFQWVGEKRQFREVLSEYESRYPQYRGKVLKYTARQDLRSGLIYTVFIGNAVKFIADAERYGTPFVFTLYPGGGFCLWDKESDSNLRRVLSSPSFRKVIVTQQISREYLVEQRLCRPDQIEFIYGGVLPSHLLANRTRDKQRFRDNKSTFDICFVANKQSQQGVDKGYDIFIEAAKLLSGACKEMVFHVVGPFDASDIDVSEIEDKMRFYGWRYTDFFPDFYAHMDIILSPNRPFVLSPGSFDGFPTGCCVEAGLCGVAVFCTDPLQQNIKFQDGEEIAIVKPNVREICDQVEHFYHSSEELYKLSSQGQQAFRKVFDLAAQMQPRLDLLSGLLKSV